MKVVLIGSGNVATVLGKKIMAAGHDIVQVVGRSLAKAEVLASHLKSIASDNIMNISEEGDIYVIAVPDDKVVDIASKLHLDNRLIVHTAGSLSLEILSRSSTSYGVLYPLQSLKKEMSKLPEVPVLIDGNSSCVIEKLQTFAEGWAKGVWKCADEERLKLHVAAVIASNFTNHLYTLAERYCVGEGLDFKMLYPLIKETVERIEGTSPSSFQTGPASRGDLKTIQKHQEYLESYPAIKTIYEVLSESIISNVKGLRHGAPGASGH